MDLTTLLISLGSGGTVGGSLLIWAFKKWIDSVNAKLSSLEIAMNNIQMKTIKNEGLEEKESALIWREINTDKQKIIKMQSQLEKAWETISKIASPRVSDLISKSLKEE